MDVTTSIEYITEVAVGLLALLGAMGAAVVSIKRAANKLSKNKSKSFGIIETIRIVKLLRGMYNGHAHGALATPFDGATIHFYHTPGPKSIHSQAIMRAYVWLLGNVLKRMRMSGCDAGRDYIANFSNVTELNDLHQEVYLTWAESLRHDDVVAIYFVIPIDNPSLSDFRDRCHGIKRPTFRVVATRAEAPE